MVGDYNYPVFKENLGQKVREQGYELNLSDARTYTRYRFFRGHYDFATSVGFDIEGVPHAPTGFVRSQAHPRHGQPGNGAHDLDGRGIRRLRLSGDGERDHGDYEPQHAAGGVRRDIQHVDVRPGPSAATPR